MAGPPTRPVVNVGGVPHATFGAHLKSATLGEVREKKIDVPSYRKADDRFGKGSSLAVFAGESRRRAGGEAQLERGEGGHRLLPQSRCRRASSALTVPLSHSRKVSSGLAHDHGLRIRPRRCPRRSALTRIVHRSVQVSDNR